MLRLTRRLQNCPVLYLLYRICVLNPVAYNGPFNELYQCPRCTTSRYDGFQLEVSRGRIKEPAQQFFTLPLGPQLQALWRNPEIAQQMEHRRRKTQEILKNARETGKIECYDDIYHGSEYLKACFRGDISEDGIVVTLSIDRAQLYKSKEPDCWMFIWVVSDLPETIRYKITM
jgi:hypothetical protein